MLNMNINYFKLRSHNLATELASIIEKTGQSTSNHRKTSTFEAYFLKRGIKKLIRYIK